MYLQVAQFLVVCFMSISWPHVAADIQDLTSWKLVSSENINASGAAISTPGFAVGGWYNATVPCTVMACLIDDNGLFPDVFFGGNIELVNASAFDVSWWYRTEFSLVPGPAVVLTFHGLNYRANVWLNGVQIASSADVAGAFRYFEFTVTDTVVSSVNALAVEVFRPHDRSLPSTNHDTDLAITFVDWAPVPPDSNMGLWRSVQVASLGGPVSVRYPSVETVLSANNTIATLTILAELGNRGNVRVPGNFTAEIRDPDGRLLINITQNLYVHAAAAVTVYFEPTAFPLVLQSPQLWWPWQMGAPALHTLTLRFDFEGVVSDELTVQFGIRQMSSELDANGHRLYSVNNQPILVRGAGWTPDLFLRGTPDRVAQELAYARDMNMNALRLEGKMNPDFFFDMTDQLGMLVIPGWCCCDAWQHWKWWKAEQYNISAESMNTQFKRLRIRASVLAFYISSDELPPKDVEQEYLNSGFATSWPNPITSAASAATSKITGPTGVKMSGPYSWVPPNYWLEDTSLVGGAFGFLTEGGPGENPLTLESLLRTVPTADLWPPQPNNCWGHCGSPLGFYAVLDRFNGPLTARYGAATSLADYLETAHVQSYEGHRAFFEGYSRNKYASATGLVQWMLNNAWPMNIWHQYDYYLNPGPAYFATKRACEPVHIMYSYDDASVWVVNSLYQPMAAGLLAIADVLTLTNAMVFNHTLLLQSVDPDSSVPLFKIPSQAQVAALLGADQTYLVRLRLLDPSASVVSENVYWLSTTPDVLDWANSTWYNTPCSSYANFSQLRSLPPVTLAQSAQVNQTSASITLTNPSQAVAFFVRLRLVLDGSDVLPIIWSDNYFHVFPGEKRTVTASFAAQSAEPQPVVELWNAISGSGRTLHAV
eukprot:TRINITY_DN2808_c0_g1_i2.p1 TRINITY_DN2808_c0_g1~~TRINITY_DN2808_c0_g1_i2.p1  ORF type:complete len:880 (-),score=312.93 TRINITY_DN2808_c0_g1_i2:92-2731(-)